MQAIQRRASNTTREVVESANTRKIESEEEMHQDKPSSRLRILVPTLAALIAVSAAVIHVGLARAQSNAPATPLTDSDLVAQFRHVEVASVSDALEQITHKKMYMSHRMQPIFTAKFAGFARTVQLKKDEGNNDPEALTRHAGSHRSGIDRLRVRDGGRRRRRHRRNGWTDGHCDGSAWLCRSGDRRRRAGRGLSAQDRVSRLCHRYRSLDLGASLPFCGAQIPVVCNGVPVNPGDIVVADSDGVAVVPKAQAQAVLTLAQQMDYKEHSMYALIEQLKSIVQAVKKVGRL